MRFQSVVQHAGLAGDDRRTDERGADDNPDPERKEDGV
jgi:hypothetical protein